MDIGAIIKDQYKVIEHIGRGGMADVWSAQDMRLRRMVAIKTIARGLSSDVDPVSLFEKEAQTIARMEHPHILPIYDFGDYEGSLYIVMRFVTGGSLETLLRQGPMSTTEALKMGEAIAHALDYAHENNIIHLDLKPPNILLGSGQTPYLADFGLATVLDMEGRARNPGSGTLLYMAPEQLVAEMIDRRADIYSFCVMMFHMLTGQLPFEGETPLALAQLQGTGIGLPEMDTINPELPYQLSDILRRGTAQNPTDRPGTLMEIIDEMRAIISPVATTELWMGAGILPGEEIPAVEMSAITEKLIGAGDAELLEAVDIYTRARHQWAGGQGRFLLGVSHFMLISGYYQNAGQYGLSMDESGYEMMLRGALEYDFEADYWWSKVNDESRRRVCFHALRSMNTPARIRAMYRLETLSDDPANPQIPRLVSQALEIERDDDARIAAIRVLATRARLLKPRQQYKVATDYQGRLLTSMTRLGIQILPPSVWQEVIYTPEIDLLIAENALDTESERVAEFAARTIGQMRSLTAVRYLAHHQLEGRPGALQALALVRDEAPALPDVVSRQGRWYAWITNTARRLTARPLDGILRFILVLLGGWIGMGELVYTTFRSQSLFTAQRWGNAIAIGLVFGLFVAVMVMVADEFSRRLERFWQWWMRLLLFGALGYLMGELTYSAFTWLYLQYVPHRGIMRVAGFALAFGFVISPLLKLRGWQAVLLSTFVAYLPVYALYRSFYFPKYFSVTPVALAGLLVGMVIGLLIRHQARMQPHVDLPLPGYARTVLSVLFGSLWAVAMWASFTFVYERFQFGYPLDWDGVLGLFVANIVFGTAFAYFVTGRRLLAFALAAVAASIAFELTAGWWFYTAPEMPGLVDRFLFYLRTGGWLFYQSAYQPPNLLGWNTPLYIGVPFAPAPNSPIFYLDPPQMQLNMVITVGVPMLLAIVLGGNFQMLVRGWWDFIGKAKVSKERPGWLTIVLLYTLIVSALISVLALFSMHVSVPWALAWSLWGWATFVFALATWRWARWGAKGLVVCGVVLIGGGFLADGFDVLNALNRGNLPPLSQMLVIPVHPGYIAAADTFTALLSIITSAPSLWIAWLVGVIFGIRSISQRKRRGYIVTTLMGLMLFGALYVAQKSDFLPISAALPEGLLLFQVLAFPGAIVLYVQSGFLWGMWALGMLLAVYGALRGYLWGGISLMVLLGAWFGLVLFGGVPGSLAALAAVHVALLAYALRPAWAHMEAGRWSWRPAADTETATGTIPAVPAVPDEQLAPTVPVVRPAEQPALEPATELAVPVDPALLETSLDAASLVGATDEAINARADKGWMRTELDPTALLHNTDEAREESERPAVTPPKIPKIKLDTAALRSSAKPDSGPAAPASKPAFQIKLDTSAPRTTRTDDTLAPKKPDSKPPTVKIDNTLAPKKTDSNPPAIKLDTTPLRKNPDAEPPTRKVDDTLAPKKTDTPVSGAKPLPIKLDTTSLKVSRPDEAPEDTPPPAAPEEPVPSDQEDGEA